jgi:hypothetical protein
VPDLPIPEAHVRLTPAVNGGISWLGSVGARHYVRERAATPQGEWVVIDAHVMEDSIPFVPYCDANALKESRSTACMRRMSQEVLKRLT